MSTVAGRLILVCVLLFGFASSCWSQKAVVIDPERPTGAVVRHFGWDAKLYANLCNSPKNAEWLYGESPANIMRIPIRPRSSTKDGKVNFDGHPSDGGYGPLIDSIKMAKKVNPDIKIFASTKLMGAETFPDWLCSDRVGKIFKKNVRCPDPQKYAGLVHDYIERLAAEEIKIDFLGLNNEVGDALTPDIYSNTAQLLQEKLKESKIPEQCKNFQWVGGEEFGVPSSVRYGLTLKKSPAKEYFDVVGSHFYPDVSSGEIKDWRQLRSLGVPMWHTEVHLRDKDGSRENIIGIRDAMCIVFKTNEEGCQGYVWWSGTGNRDELANLVRHQMIKSMLYGSCVRTSGSYEAKDNAPDKLVGQATRVGDTVWLWCFNPNGAVEEVPIRLSSGVIQSCSASYFAGGKKVTPESLGELEVKRTEKNEMSVFKIPKESIVVVRIDLQDDEMLLPAQTWKRIKPKQESFSASLSGLSGKTLSFKTRRGKKIRVPIKSLAPEHYPQIQDALRAHGIKW